MVFIQHQVSLRTGETLQAKHKFEQLAREHGVAVKSYHAENSPFGNADFVRSIEDNGQAIKFSGVGAHHQNGVAECTIKTISSWARTMLLHATIHWPEQNQLTLWPYAFDHAVFLWNNLPSRTTPLSFSPVSPSPPMTISNEATFGVVQLTSWILNSEMVRNCLNGKLVLITANTSAFPRTILAPLVASSIYGLALSAPNTMLFTTISLQWYLMLNLVVRLSRS